MPTYSGRCPVCGQEMLVTRFYCRSCDTALEGQFTLNRFARLTTEQLAFLETFVRCQGKLSWVGDEMDLSYPAVRSRLADVIRALGFDLQEEPPAEQQRRSALQRQAILDDLATGKITAEQAVQMLHGER